MEKCKSLPGRATCSTSVIKDTEGSRSLSMERLKGSSSLTGGMDREENGASLKFSSLEKEVKVAVLGPPGVGKSALVVRYLTKRYIGDYADCESICTGSKTWGYKRLKVHLLDTRGDKCNKTLEDEKLSWADGVLLIFSIADRTSFTLTSNMIEEIIGKNLSQSCAFVLVGNKSDLDHLREVTADEGHKLADSLGCPYVEASARESYTTTVKAFSTLFLEVKYHQKRKTKGRKGNERRNASSTVLHQLRDSIRNLASEFRQRTNTF